MSSSRTTGRLNTSKDDQPISSIETSSFLRWDRRVERTFLVFLVVSLGYLVYSSTHKLLWFDEFLSYYTESAPSTAAVLKIQAATPVSLDPPFYHLLGHWVLDLGWNKAFSVRLPSLLGIAIMVAGIYLYTRRIAGIYAAAISVALLILTYDFYLVEARPYGILLGTTALSLLLWQNCVRGANRLASLFGLLLVLALAVSCHYFGILVAIPLLLAEAIRTFRRRRFDVPVIAAIFSSYFFVVFWLPFLSGAKQYKANYYIKPNFMECIRSYSWLDEIHRNIKGLSSGVDLLLFLIIVSTVIVGAYFGYKASSESGGCLSSIPEEWAALVFIALLPVSAGILSVAGAGSYLPRYVLESSIGLVVPRVSGILYFVNSRLAKTLILCVCSLLIVIQFSRDRTRDRRDMAMLDFSVSQANSGVVVIPDQYDDFMRLHYYFQDKLPQASLYPFVVDMDRELSSKGTDNLSRTMLNMKQFTDLPVITYEDLIRNNQKLVVIESKSDKHSWIVEQLKKDHAEFTLRATQRDHSAYDVSLRSAPNSAR